MNDFDSIDRLLEFGLGMSVACQMMETMNQAIAGMAVPGAGQPISVDSRTYFAVIGGKQAGPFSVEELKLMVKDGGLKTDTLMWTQGLPAWKLAGEIAEINKLFMLLPPVMD